MILIEKIKVIQTNLEPTMIAHALSCDYEPMSTDYIPPEITTEMVRGRRFVNIRGEEVCIGMSKQVQQAIGLPFEVYDVMENNITFFRKRNQNLESKNFSLLKRIEWHQTMGFLGRVKFLFTRKVED